MTFFTDDTCYSGPPLTDEMIRAAEARVGFRLPRRYVGLLREKDGGVPIRRNERG